MHTNLEQLNKKETDSALINRLSKEADIGLHQDFSAIDAVKFRMDQYGLNQKQFSKIICMSEPNFSEFLTGKRKLTRTAVKRCVAIGVSPLPLIIDLFLGKKKAQINGLSFLWYKCTYAASGTSISLSMVFSIFESILL